MTEYLKKLQILQLPAVTVVVAIAVALSLPTLGLVESWIKYPLFVLEIFAILIVYLSLNNKYDFNYNRNINVNKVIFGRIFLFDALLIGFSSILFLLNLVGTDGGIFQLVLALLCTSFLSGYALVRIFRINKYLTKLEVIVLSYILSLIFSGLCTLSLLSLDQNIRGYILPVLFGSLGLISILRCRNFRDRDDPKSKRRPDSLSRRLDILCISFCLAFYLVFFTFLYPDAATLPGLDIARHYNYSVVLSRTPEIYYAGGNYLLFHAFQASLHVLSGLQQTIMSFQTSLVLLNLFLPVSVYIFARRYLAGIDKRVPAISAIFYTILSNLSFIYFLQLKLLDTNGTAFIVLAREVAEKAYNGVINFSQPFNFFFPTSVSFIMLMFVFILLRVRYIPRFTYIPLFSTIIFALFFVHRVEAIVFVLLLAAFSMVFKAKNGLRLDDALLASLIGFIFAVGLSAYPASFWASDIGDTEESTLSILSLFVPIPITGAAMLWRWKVLSRIRFKINLPNKPKFYSMLSISLVSVYLLGLLTWLAIEDFRASSVFELGVVPWFIYPVLLGVVGLLALLSIRYMGNILANTSLTILFFSILFMLLMGKLISLININLIVIDYWEKRFVTMIFLIACLFAPVPLIVFRDYLNQKRRNVLNSAAVTSMISIVILLGFSSTAVQSEFWFSYSDVPNFKVSQKEMEAISFLKNILRNDGRAFTISPSTHSKEVLTLAAPAYQFSKPQISVFSKYPDIPLLTLASHNLDHAYLYMHDRDFKILNDQEPHGWLDQHMIPMMPAVFSNEEVKIYNATKVSYPLPNSETAILIPSDPRENNWFYAYDIVAQTGKNYTVKLDKDPNVLGSKNVILSFDPTEKYSFYDKFSSSTKDKWDVISGRWKSGSDGLVAGGKEMFGDILSPVVSSTNYNVSTSFRITNLEPKVPNYVSIIYSWIDSKNYKLAGITINPKDSKAAGLTAHSYELYANFGSVIDGTVFWDLKWPGSRMDLDWKPGDLVNMTLTSRDTSYDLIVNGTQFLHQSPDNHKRGYIGLSYGRVSDVVFHNLEVVNTEKVNSRPLADYITYAKAGGSLTVVNADDHNGYIADYLFSGGLSGQDPHIKKVTTFPNVNTSISDIPGDIKSIDDGPYASTNQILPNSFNASQHSKSSAFAVEADIGRGKITYINLYPLVSNLDNSTYNNATYSVLQEISNLITGLDDIDDIRPNLNDIAAFYREINGTANRINLNAESAIFPDNFEFSKIMILHGNNNRTFISNISGIDIDDYQNITLNGRNSYMSLTNGRGLYTDVFLNTIGHDSSLELFFEDDAIIKLSDGSMSYRFENVSGIDIVGKNQSMNVLLRQPTIRVVDGSLTIKELHSTRQLYEKTGAFGHDLMVSGNMSLGAYLSDYYTLASQLNINGSMQRMPLLSELENVESSAPQVALSNLYFVPPFIRALIVLPFIITGIFLIFVKPIPKKAEKV